MNKLAEKKKLQSEIDASAGRHLVLSSVKDLNKLLFGELKLSTVGLRPLKSGLYPTSSAALRKIKSSHPIVKLILQYKDLSPKKPVARKSPVKKSVSVVPVVRPVTRVFQNQIVREVSVEKKIRMETIRILMTLCALAVAVFIFRQISMDYTDNFVDTVQTSGESI